MYRHHRTTLVATLALGALLLAPAEGRARSGYYGTACTTCHEAAESTCNGCHQHRGTVTGSIPKTTFTAGESFNVTVTAGGRSGAWGAAVLDEQNKVVGSTKATGPGATTVKVTAPATAGSHAWKAAWYGNKYTSVPSAATWVANPDNADHGYVTVALPSFTVGSAAAPSASLAPAALDLGTVTTGQSASKTATVTNAGTADLVVDAPVSCDSSTSAFVTVSPSTGFTVAAGRSATLTVTFAPSSTGAARGCWKLATNDSAHATLQLTATGTGKAAGSSSSSGGSSSSGASSSGAPSSSGGSSSSGAGSSSGGSSSSSGGDDGTQISGGCSSAGGALPLLGLLAVALGAVRRRRAG